MRSWRGRPSALAPAFDVTVAVGLSRARRVADRMGYDWDAVSDSDGCTVHSPGCAEALVCFRKSVLRFPPGELAAIVAHEAVHCAQAWLESIGEGEPGSEQAAYMVQACVQVIMDGVEAERGRIEGRG